MNTIQAGFNRAILVGVIATPGLMLVGRLASCTWHDDPMYEVTLDLDDPRIVAGKYDVERETRDNAITRLFNFKGTVKVVEMRDLEQYGVTFKDLRA